MTSKRSDKPSKKPDTGPKRDTATAPLPPVDLDESVAGEEDPGASLDMAIDAPVPPQSPPPAKR